MLPSGSRTTAIGWRRRDARTLSVLWENGDRNDFDVRDLRLACRCALCVEEMSGRPLLDPKSVRPDVTPRTVTSVGNYAITISWTRPSGLLAIRGVARDVVRHLGDSSGAQYFGRGLEAGVVRASEHEVYWYLSIRADWAGTSRDALTLAEHCAAAFHEPFRAIVRATRPDDLRLDELFERDPIHALGQGSGHAAGRCRASDAAPRRPGRCAGARGCRRPRSR